MKGDPEERALAVGRYLARSGATVRTAAGVFGVSKSTIWKDQARLQRLHPGLWQEVRKVLLKNKAERHLRGGEATRSKYRRLAGRPSGAPAQKTAPHPCAGAARTI